MVARTRKNTDDIGGVADYTPMASEAEQSVLACLLTDPKSFDDVVTRLDPEDFANEKYGDIYRAIVSCDSSGRPFDKVNVADELKKAKSLTRVGGVQALESLIVLAPSVANLESHVDIVLDKSMRRKLLLAGQIIGKTAMDPSESSTSALSKAEQTVFELGKRKQEGSLMDMGQAVPLMLNELKKTRTSLLVGTSTGYRDLDKYTSGLQGGQLIILAARPSIGKSALALQLAANLSKTSGKIVPFLSYEMSITELTIRLLAANLNYDIHKLRVGEIPPGMDKDLAEQAQEMAKMSLWVDDNPPETIGGVRSQMRRLANRGEVGAIVIDYLQLMSAGSRRGDENRTQEISEITRGLKRLATELDVPVIALSQLNRGPEQRPNKRPVLSDLRESGSLEQDASMVMFLYRDHYYNAAADPTLAECIIAKQRNGPVGTVYLEFKSECAKFSTTDKKPLTPEVSSKNEY